MLNKQTLLIADDHQIFIDGLLMIFSDLEFIDKILVASNGYEALELFKEHTIDVAILDVNMPKPNGFELCNQIKEKFPNTKIMILSMYGDEHIKDEFLKMGVYAYILKNAGKHELINALRCVIEGKNYISKALRSNPTESSEDNFVKSLTLTKREKEIIALLTQEKSSQEIADALFISVYTVNTHRKNILHKLGIKNTAGLVKFALDNQLI